MRNISSITCFLVLIGVIYCDGIFTYPFQISNSLHDCDNKTFVTEDCREACEFVVQGWIVNGTIQRQTVRDRAMDLKHFHDHKFPLLKTISQKIYDGELVIIDDCMAEVRTKNTDNVCEVAQLFNDCRVREREKLEENVQKLFKERTA